MKLGHKIYSAIGVLTVLLVAGAAYSANAEHSALHESINRALMELPERERHRRSQDAVPTQHSGNR